MTQHPQDQFDEVPPYGDGEVGKHRTPAPEPEERRGGAALRGVTLLAVLALLVGAFSYFVLPRLPEGWVPLADGDEASQQESEPSGGPSDESAASTPTGEESSAGESSAEATPTAADTETAVQIIDAGLPEGGLDDVEAQLADMQYNVTSTAAWEESWGEVETPVIYYPSGEQEHAQDLAENFGVERVEENDNWTYVALVVGAEQGE